MQGLREMIKKLFFPYESPLHVAVISNEEQNVLLLKNILYPVFDSDNTILNQIANLSYKKDNDIFSFIVNDATEIKFSIHEKISDSNSGKTDFYGHDLLIFVLRLNKYSVQEYDQTAHATDVILSSTVLTGKPVIVTYLDTQHMIEENIKDEEHWQRISNNLYNLIIDYSDKQVVNYTEYGKSLLQGLFKVFNYHSKNQQLFRITQKVNFFASNNSDLKCVYGKNEFAANFLMQLLSFDQLNFYNFGINWEL